MTRAHLTLRDRRILANLGKRHAHVATPYVDRAKIDAIVAREHARALKREHDAQRAGVSPELTARQALFQRYTSVKKALGNALFSWVPAYIAAGALGMWLAMQPTLDTAENARLAAEQIATQATQHVAGHTTVNLTGSAHEVALYARGIAHAIAADRAPRAGGAAR
jgi:hypothetical protein